MEPRQLDCSGGHCRLPRVVEWERRATLQPTRQVEPRKELAPLWGQDAGVQRPAESGAVQPAPAGSEAGPHTRDPRCRSGTPA